MIILRLLDLLLRMAALLTCLFLLVSYTSILDAFPWGNSEAYVIWGLLVAYFIFPLFLLYAFMRFVRGTVMVTPKREAPDVTTTLIFIPITIMIMIPLWIGFDQSYDTTGRWAGVITSLISVVLVAGDLKKGILKFKTTLQGSK